MTEGTSLPPVPPQEEDHAPEAEPDTLDHTHALPPAWRKAALAACVAGGVLALACIVVAILNERQQERIIRQHPVPDYPPGGGPDETGSSDDRPPSTDPPAPSGPATVEGPTDGVYVGAEPATAPVEPRPLSDLPCDICGATEGNPMHVHDLPETLDQVDSLPPGAHTYQRATAE